MPQSRFSAGHLRDRPEHAGHASLFGARVVRVVPALLPCGPECADTGDSEEKYQGDQRNLGVLGHATRPSLPVCLERLNHEHGFDRHHAVPLLLANSPGVDCMFGKGKCALERGVRDRELRQFRAGDVNGVAVGSDRNLIASHNQDHQAACGDGLSHLLEFEQSIRSECEPALVAWARVTLDRARFSPLARGRRGLRLAPPPLLRHARFVASSASSGGD